jgi:putative aldouronate transport system substrate-binding protein
MKRMLAAMICLLLVGGLAMAAATGETASTGGKGAPVKIKGMANQYKYAPPKDSEFWQAMEKRYNVDYTVDWVPADTYNEKVDLVLASGDLPDTMQVQVLTRPSVLKAIKAGAFVNLTPYLGDFGKYPNLAKLNPTGWSYSKVDGKNFLVPRTRGNLDSALFIRGDYLKKLGVGTPKTLDEFAAVMKKIVTSDLDGNGKIDTMGVFPNEGYFSSAFGTKAPVYTKDGQGIVNKMLTEGYAQYVAYMRDLYTAGAIPKEFALIKGTQQEELFLAGRVSTWVKNAWHKYRAEQEVKKLDPNASVALLPYLDGPGGFAHIWDLGYFAGQLLSSKDSKEKVEGILKFFNDSSAESEYNFVNYGMEGVHYVLKDGFPSLTDKGKQEVTASFNAPFIFATAEFAKTDSPLAPMSYNLQTREEMKVLYAKKGQINLYDVLQSDGWTAFWARVANEFASREVDAITGKITIDQFRAYQADLMKDPDVQKSFKEFADSYKQIFGK